MGLTKFFIFDMSVNGTSTIGGLIMQASVLYTTGTGSVHYPSVTPRYVTASVAMSEDQLRGILEKHLCSDLKHTGSDLTKLIEEKGQLTCEVIFVPQDPRQPKDSRDHIVVQFVLYIPTSS